ncbi:E3 ubiquitin-protein ligase RFWD3-like isoform X2 [Zootermopsis nevadensis]|nr:E3 ubiquitin-protein ligase RFWD3-like isoform X2 [Zootermopsis nevadensis]
MFADDREESLQRQETSMEVPGTSASVQSITQFAPSTSQSTASPSVAGALDQDSLQLERSSPQKSQGDGKKQVNCDKAKDHYDDGSMCSICLEMWSNSGNHRLSSLRCGHFFGHSCIMRWLKSGSQNGMKRCPQCNEKARKKEIRLHYARKLQALDTADRDWLKGQLDTVKREKNMLELELARANLNQRLLQEELSELRQTLMQMQETEARCTRHDVQKSDPTSVKNMGFYRSFQVHAGDCRVLAYNKYLSLLVASQYYPVFRSYGLSKFDTRILNSPQMFPIHEKEIRDLAFHPLRYDMLLSVSLDQSAKLFDVANNRIFEIYPSDNPLWSCCWDVVNTNLFYVGTSKGAVIQHDIRYSTKPVWKITTPNDSSPVTSIAAIPACPGRTLARGGFLACTLNSCWAYEGCDADYVGTQLPFDGPFVSLKYDKASDHVLISTRPNIHFPYSRHIVCQLPKTSADSRPDVICAPVHTFQGGTSQKLLSRPCLVPVCGEDTLVAAYQESLKTIALWSMSSGEQILTCPAYLPLIDLCPIGNNSSNYLVALSTRSFALYHYN